MNQLAFWMGRNDTLLTQIPSKLWIVSLARFAFFASVYPLSTSVLTVDT